MRRYLALIFITLVLTLPVCSPAQTFYQLTPQWISSEVDNYSTGAAWADINRDGWLDLVFSNGNDMRRREVTVFYNDSTGAFHPTPSWNSLDIDYHGHLSIGDVDGDGYPDVAVSVYLGEQRFAQRGKVKLYRNDAGTLTSNPVWTSADSMYTFSCAFGDADGDGDLDLAVACGEGYTNRAEYQRVYFNRGGKLDSLPAWKSRALTFALDVTWADFDNDGRLDLAFASENGPMVMYKNYGDSIATVPTWRATDAGMNANSIFATDVNNDARIDLAVSDNNQLGGEGRCKIYLNTASGLQTMPAWTSDFSGLGSGITSFDIDGDGFNDLITGGWWEPIRIYMNDRGTFPRAPTWTSNTSSVVEAIVAADADNKSITKRDTTIIADGTRKLFRIVGAPLQSIDTVRVGAKRLTHSEYCFSAENGWVSLAVAPVKNTSIVLSYRIASARDLVVSNWDPDTGNYLFLHQRSTSSARTLNAPSGFILQSVYPNPCTDRIAVACSVPRSSVVTLTVRDVLGRSVAVSKQAAVEGLHRFELRFPPIAPGLYFLHASAAGESAVRRIMKLR